MEQEIGESLDQIENDERVRVLYAVESGSRAWGFASADSDWDVRFIYARRADWYLSVQRRRDVLEYTPSNGLDMKGVADAPGERWQADIHWSVPYYRYNPNQLSALAQTP